MPFFRGMRLLQLLPGPQLRSVNESLEGVFVPLVPFVFPSAAPRRGVAPGKHSMRLVSGPLSQSADGARASPIGLAGPWLTVLEV